MLIASVVFTTLTILITTSILLRVYHQVNKKKNKKHFAVVVLGDVGRSPRMQYHTVSLSEIAADKGNDIESSVTLIGYSGEECIESLRSKKNVYVQRLKPFKNHFPGIPFLFFAIFKVVYQVAQLTWCLFITIPSSNAILVQNPPSIPTLFIVWIACKLHNARFIIDWHNFGYTILSLKLSNKHPLVIVSKIYERFFGQFADNGLCVTKAMKKWLKTEWNINANVLYDRAPTFFRRTTLEEKHNLFKRLRKEFISMEKENVKSDTRTSVVEETLFTRYNKTTGKLTLRHDRPLLAISSTSWTPDEDFGVLLDAIVQIGEKVKGRIEKGNTKKENFPKIIFIITGKGPQKAMYQAKIAKLQLSKFGIYILTMWLESADYPLLLGSADLGISLHTSSSGLDLPMKVVDMFGCGLPVCAYDFKCLNELVQHNKNGYVFNNSKMLAEQMFSLFENYVDENGSELKRLGENVKEFQSLRWKDNWNECAKPLFM
jgi:beta-1,4-mannosyltransferase